MVVAIRRHTHALFGWTMIHRIHFNRQEAKVSKRQQQLGPCGKRAAVTAR